MRSQRSYQQAFPTDRILAVLQQNDGSRFDQRLVRRFSQLYRDLPDWATSSGSTTGRWPWCCAPRTGSLETGWCV